MKARTRNPWRLARLNRRLTHSQLAVRKEKRGYRGWGLNHHEPLHQTKLAAPKTIVARAQRRAVR